MPTSNPRADDRQPVPDLLINDRLKRSSNLRVGDVYRAIGAREKGGGALWTLYLRIYEILWKEPRGSLAGTATDDRLEGDAWLGARLIRSYARDWLEGSGRFAALLLPHLLENQKSQSLSSRCSTPACVHRIDPQG